MYKYIFHLPVINSCALGVDSLIPNWPQGVKSQDLLYRAGIMRLTQKGRPPSTMTDRDPECCIRSEVAVTTTSHRHVRSPLRALAHMCGSN